MRNSHPTSRRKPGLIDGIVYGIRNRHALKAIAKVEAGRCLLGRANLLLGKLDRHDPLYYRRVAEFNEAFIEVHKGKWYSTLAMYPDAKVSWQQAFKHLNDGAAFAGQLLNQLVSGSTTPIPHTPATLRPRGTEIQYANDVPLVPEINPIVIVQGSDYDMGFQYARQLIDIFGSWALQRRAGRHFSPEEQAIMREWENQIRTYAPEILELCRGWAAGATAAGVAMSYEDVLEIWTGHRPPATSYLGLGDSLPDVNPPACTGNAAWGRATKDGRLVTGSSGDHDCIFMVTIVAFPESGNNFIYTPFAITGDVPRVGAVHMMGHPGINNKGVSYVHHGGAPHLITRQEDWGYGIRLGTSVFHLLRFAESAQAARDLLLSYPAGDEGNIIGVGGVPGFYADSRYGFVMESNRSPVIVREAGVMGEMDFLYANNGAIHPEAEQAGWIQEARDSWTWEEHGGWRPSQFTLKRDFKKGMNKLHQNILSAIYQTSFPRNQFAYQHLSAGVGSINLEYMRTLYRQSGSLPEGDWEELKAAYNASGTWGECGVGHASNALVVLTKPDNGDNGVYAVCVGTARRGVTPMSPTSFAPIYNETNAFWEIRLAGDPEGVASSACQKAQENLENAQSALARLSPNDGAYEPLRGYLDSALAEYEHGAAFQQEAQANTNGTTVYSWAKATRAYTRAQVRAAQVVETINPPPANVRDL